MKKYYLFDLDGTLLDTVNIIAKTMNKVLEKYFGRTIAESRYKDFLGEGPKALVDGVYAEIGGTGKVGKEEILSVFLKEYESVDDQLTRPYDGILEALDFLKKKGKILGICTNKPQKTAEKLIEKIFGKDYFQSIVGYSREDCRKPQKAPLIHLVKNLGGTIDESIYFGDTEVDLKTAKNASMDVVLCLWGFRSKEDLQKQGGSCFIDHPLQIKEIR